MEFFKQLLGVDAASSADPDLQSQLSSTSSLSQYDHSSSSRPHRHHHHHHHALLANPRIAEKAKSSSLSENSIVERKLKERDMLAMQQREILRALAEKERDDSIKAMKIKLVQPPSITTFSGRVRSFDNWPLTPKDYPMLTPENMAASAFEFAPSFEFRDCVCCVYCYLRIGEWSKKDDPMAIHRKLSPNCPYINGKVIEDTLEDIRKPRIYEKKQKWIVMYWNEGGRICVPAGTSCKIRIDECRVPNGLLQIVAESPQVRSIRIDDCENVNVIAPFVNECISVNRSYNVVMVIGSKVPCIAVTHCVGCVLYLDVNDMRSDVVVTESRGVTVVDAQTKQKHELPEDCRWFKCSVENRYEDHVEEEKIKMYKELYKGTKRKK